MEVASHTSADSSGLTMHYPSKRTCYYAIGSWMDRVDAKDAHFQFCPNNRILRLYGRQPPEDHLFAIFQANLNPDNTKLPSEEKQQYWIQAPIAERCVSRLPNITCNSGKFMVFVPESENIDKAWECFKNIYAKGKLGYAIQCSTSRPSPHDPKTSSGMIAIYTEDCFDLQNIIETSYNIFTTCFDIWPNFKGTLQVMTDLSIQAKCNCSVKAEAGMLYSISSRTFLQDPLSQNKEPKPLKDYRQILNHKLLYNAQKRQNDIVGKSTPKISKFPISTNGGKFLVFIPSVQSIDKVRAQFIENHSLGCLGDSISCSETNCLVKQKNSCSGLITVHVPDRRDLSAITWVSYNIFDLCFTMPGYKEGVLQFMADSSNDKKPLLSISSRTYLKNCNENTEPKPFDVYSSLIDSKFGSLVKKS